MGFMDKAKELASKAEQAINSLDAPTPNRSAEPLFRELGGLVFDREQGRSDERNEAEIARVLDALRSLEAQAGGRLATATAHAQAAPPPPGAAAQMAAQAPPPAFDATCAERRHPTAGSIGRSLIAAPSGRRD